MEGVSDQFFIKGVIGGGYKPENNFKLSDFSPEMQQQLSEARPDLFAPSGDASVQEIITALQLEPDAWDEERKRFVVQKWETGIDFLSSMAGYDGQQIVDLYTGKSQPDPPPSTRLWRYWPTTASRTSRAGPRTR